MTAANRRALRTLIQTTLALATTLPAIVHASGIRETLPWIVGTLAVAGGLARVMALPSVEAILDRFGLGLVDDAKEPTAP